MLVVLLVVGGLVWTGVRPEPYTVDPDPGPDVPSAQPALAASALHSLEQAVAADDPEAASALAPDGDAAAAHLLAAIVTNARALRVRDFSLRYVDETGAVDAEGAWQAAVDTTWQLRGFDRAPARTEVRFGFVPDGDRVALGSVGGGSLRTPLWLAGPVAVRRSADSLVLASSPRDADRYARLATRAVPVVHRVLAGWRARLVVEVPRSVDALDAALSASAGTYDNVAAVTTSVDGSLAPGSPIHVFVNPDIFGRLRSVGAQVVMSHETTHVATDAARSRSPLWLVEGFADYVALRDVDLPISTTAGQILAEVRRDGPPGHLPGAAEFDTSTSHLGASYESAWLVCQVLADRGGGPALVRLYRRVDAGADLGRALRSGFGWSVRDLTRAWQERLADLAG